jgi:predicted MPP superfamily phosphohydrolase
MPFLFQRGRRARLAERHERQERQPRGPRLKEHEVVVPGLDPAHDGLKVAHLTDLHVGMLTPDRKILRAITRAQAMKPDLVLLTGDFVCYSPKFVGKLKELIAGIEAPVYAVLGNHDYWTDGQGVRHALERNGYAVLRNGHSELQLRHAPITIVGIDDAITGHADVKRAFRGVRPSGSRLVLTHAPNMADRAAEFGGSLIVAGHTHGGHVNIPRVTAGIARRLGNRYLAGWYRVSQSLLYVNCGIGSSSVPIRAGAPSEVALFTLRAPPAA